MAFQLSPGINVSEIDLTNAVPAVGTSEGAFVGTFRWGPTNERVLLGSEVDLVSRFGKPYNSGAGWSNQESFFTAANFLGYSNALYVTRADDSTAVVSGGTNFQGRYKGEIGDSLKVISCDDSSFRDTTSTEVTGSTISIGRGQAFGDIQGPSPSAGPVKTFRADVNSDVNYDAVANGLTFDIDISSSTADAANDVFTHTAHGLVSGDRVGITLSAAYADVTAQDYFVRREGANTFKLFATQEQAVGVGATGLVDIDATNVSAADTATTVMTVTREAVAANTFYIENHGFTDGDDLTYLAPTSGDTDPIGPLTSSTAVYYARNVTTNTFQISETPTGGIIDIYQTPGSEASGVHSFNTRAATAPIGNANASANFFKAGNIIVVGDNVTLKITSVDAWNETFNSQRVHFERKYWGNNISGGAFQYDWEGSEYFDSAPQSGKFHVAVIDEDGEFGGTAGALLETFANLSTTQGDKNFDGSNAYIGAVLDADEGLSQYISLKAANPSLAGKKSESFTGGNDGYTETDPGLLGAIMQGWDLYKSSDEVDVSLLLTGTAIPDIQNYVMDNIAEYRKDCVAFLSPTKDDITAQQIVDYVNSESNPISGSSYSVIDTGYKYQYDKYNDKYCWVPLNADVAGTCARTDGERDPWFSPAGYSRGQIKNVIKLKLNPNKTQRDLLYKNNVNPVIIEPGSGAILFGDKTMQRNPSAFDRINVRRLFIVLEKAIALASKSTLFEFNDEFTRSTFRNMIEPFLRDVQGRRGIYDFKVVCDETNNTGEVIDTNRFIGDIYIKPARSINFIQLNFVAVRTGVEFNEIIGQ